MREITYSEEVREAMVEEMRRDPSVFLFGEDVRTFGGVWGVSAGMLEEFREECVRDTPISEAAIIGAGLGAAMMGMRPIAEIMLGDFLMCAGDQIANQVAKARFMSGGKAKVPLTIRVTSGAPGSAAAQHSQSPESWFMNVPGLKIAVLAEEAIEYLDGPIVRVAAKNVPLPYSPILEDFVLPDVQDIVGAARSLLPATT